MFSTRPRLQVVLNQVLRQFKELLVFLLVPSTRLQHGDDAQMKADSTDLNSRPAAEKHNRVRGVTLTRNASPRCWTTITKIQGLEKRIAGLRDINFH